MKKEKINEKITEQALHLHKVRGSVCDHKVRTSDGMVMTFRNVCEICGENMQKETRNGRQYERN